MPEQGGSGADGDPRGRKPAPGLTAAVALCAVAGAALLLVRDAMPWYCASGTCAAPDAARIVAYGLAALAAVGALAATRAGGRRFAGLAIAALGAAIVADFAFLPWRLDGAGVSIRPPVYVAAAAGLAVAVAGVLTALRGPGWPALGSRYDRGEPDDDMWAALDRGEDPTAG